MESQIESEKIKSYYPTINDFKNFMECIKKIASDGAYAAKVKEYFVFISFLVCKYRSEYAMISEMVNIVFYEIVMYSVLIFYLFHNRSLILCAVFDFFLVRNQYLNVAVYLSTLQIM